MHAAQCTEAACAEAGLLTMLVLPVLQFLVTLSPSDAAVDGSSRLTEAVQSVGGYICGYVPDHTYRVVLPSLHLGTLAALPGDALCYLRLLTLLPCITL